MKKYLLILILLLIVSGTYCQTQDSTHIKPTHKCNLSLCGFIGTNLMILPKTNPTVQLSFGISYSNVIIKIEPNMTLVNPTMGLNLKVGLEIWSNKKSKK